MSTHHSSKQIYSGRGTAMPVYIVLHRLSLRCWVELTDPYFITLQNDIHYDMIAPANQLAGYGKGPQF